MGPATNCDEGCDEAKAYDPRMSRTATQLRSPSIAKEKAAIEGMLDQQDFALNVLLELSDELFNKFMPVLASEDAVSEKSPVDQPYYGSSQVFRRIQDQYNRTTNITEKLRILRRIAEV